MSMNSLTDIRATTSSVVRIRPQNDEGQEMVSYILSAISFLIVLLTLPFSLFYTIKVVKEYEKVVVFRLGRILPGNPKGPGLLYVLPCIDTCVKVDLRTFNFSVTLDEILLKDAITVTIEAVIYCRVSSAIVAVSHVEDYGRSTRLLAQTTLRRVLGTTLLAEVGSPKSNFSETMRNELNLTTVSMGIRVERVELISVRLPERMKRVMAAEGTASREARAMVLYAEGEKNSSEALKNAGMAMQTVPETLQMRYLQVANAIQAKTDHGSVLLFPFPMHFGV